MEHPSCTHQRRQNLPFTVSILEMKAPTVLLNAGLSLRKWIAIIHIQVWTNSLHRSNHFGPNETGILCTTRLILCCNWTDIGHQSERKSILFLPELMVYVYIWCRVLWDGWCARWRCCCEGGIWAYRRVSSSRTYGAQRIPHSQQTVRERMWNILLAGHIIPYPTLSNGPQLLENSATGQCFHHHPTPTALNRLI